MIQGHGGNTAAVAAHLGCRPEDIVDMSSNINPLGIVPGLLEHLQGHLDTIMRLPEVDAGAAAAGIAEMLAVEPAQVLMGTGTTQFIYTACTALRSRQVLIVGPTYADYASSCRMYGIEPDFFLSRAEEAFQVDCHRLADAARHYDTVFLCNPNNPTGTLIDHETLEALCRSLPDTHFIIDESYLPFAPASHDRSMVSTGLDNVIVLWSLSKIYGIPGVRAGFLIGSEAVAARFGGYMQPWCANSLAQEAVGYLVGNRSMVAAFVIRTKEYLRQEMDRFHRSLDGCGVTLFPTVAPYQLIGLPGEWTAAATCEQLLADRILLRDCCNFHGLDHHFVRVSLKSPTANQKVARLLRAALEA